jgi:hypothetical protein
MKRTGRCNLRRVAGFFSFVYAIVRGYSKYLVIPTIQALQHFGRLGLALTITSVIYENWRVKFSNRHGEKIIVPGNGLTIGIVITIIISVLFFSNGLF